MEITISILKELYKECNSKYFGNVLPDEDFVDFKLSFKPKATWTARYHYSKYMFELNTTRDYINLVILRNVLVHEMVHCYFRNEKNVGHGYKFVQFCETLNNNFTELNVQVKDSDTLLNENLITKKFIEKIGKEKEFLIIVAYREADNTNMFQVANLKNFDRFKNYGSLYTRLSFKFYKTTDIYFATYPESRKVGYQFRGFLCDRVFNEKLTKMEEV